MWGTQWVQGQKEHRKQSLRWRDFWIHTCPKRMKSLQTKRLKIHNRNYQSLLIHVAAPFPLRCNMQLWWVKVKCSSWLQSITTNLQYFCANTTRGPKVSQVARLCVNLSAEKRKPHTFVALDPFKHDQDPRLDKAALGTLNTRLSRDLRASIGQGSLRAVKRRLQYEHTCVGLI